MKKLLVLVLLCCLFSVLLAGCGGGHPYSIIDRQEGPAQLTLYVEAPVGASQSEMEQWGRELTSDNSNGKPIMINFYTGGRGADHMIGTIQGGMFIKTR